MITLTDLKLVAWYKKRVDYEQKTAFSTTSIDEGTYHLAKILASPNALISMQCKSLFSTGEFWGSRECGIHSLVREQN